MYRILKSNFGTLGLRRYFLFCFLMSCADKPQVDEALPIQSNSLKSVYLFVANDGCYPALFPAPQVRHRFADWQVDVLSFKKSQQTEILEALRSMHSRNPSLILMDEALWGPSLYKLKLPRSNNTKIATFGTSVNVSGSNHHAQLRLNEVVLLSKFLCQKMDTTLGSCKSISESCSHSFGPVALGFHSDASARVLVDWDELFLDLTTSTSPIVVDFKTTLLRVEIDAKFDAGKQKQLNEQLKFFMLEQLGQ